MAKHIRQFPLIPVNRTTQRARVPEGYILLSVGFPLDWNLQGSAVVWVICDDERPLCDLVLRFFRNNDKIVPEHPGSYVRTAIDSGHTIYHIFHLPPELSVVQKPPGSKAPK